MRKETKELVELTEKWLEKIKDITVGYERAIRSLADARAEYNKLKVISNWLFPLFSIVIILFILSFVLQHTCPNPVDIKFQGLEITQHCNATR